MPDLMIFQPNGTYNGLFLELKKQGTRVFKADENICADPHIQEQAAVMAKLNLKGYLAQFAVGFEDATEKINKYLHPLPVLPPLGEGSIAKGADGVAFFKWMNERGKNRNWYYFNMPHYRTTEEWYKIFTLIGKKK